ncbi:MAG TPA: COX15/CtaA family protein [Thermoplasmata archaeon]|nr:COX15/CtaA family protein [Thermoplasmata archaeon]
MRGHDLFRLATLFAVILCYCTILLGGNVMASDSGLACPDWPSCFGNGNLAPALQGGVALEWSHRVSAFFLATCVLVVAVLALAFERHRRVLLRLSILSLALVVTEAFLGGWVVEAQLQVPLILVHLAIATALFGLLLVLALLSNLRELPQRWVHWARQAIDETPPVHAPSAPEPVPVPADPGRVGIARREG